jgi:hypothetical protein
MTHGGPVVNCGSRGVDLQKAIDTAAAGQTLRITGNCSGGPYVIRKDVRLVGVTQEATLSAPSATGAYVLAVSGKVQVELRDFTIDGTGNQAALNIQRGAVASVSGLTIPSGKFGIVLEFNSHADIYANKIQHLTDTAIYLQHNASATITSNQLKSNLNNVGVAFNSSAVLESNSIRAATNVGVFVGRLSTVILIGNTITENAGGGVLLEPDYALVAIPSPNVVATPSPNTIEFNGNSADVICKDKGVYEADAPVKSATQRAAIASGCTVAGSIF